ncbi:MAG: putative queuosine precursor transporter, partial [Actinomycetota bacterium]|nr:putative queuosine precursor transporter [Actinomycetota bacterium]
MTTAIAAQDAPTPGYARVGSAYYPVLVAIFTS